MLTSLAGVPPLAADLAAAGQTGPILTDCSQHASQPSQPITNFGHQLLLQPQFAFGPGNGLPVLDAAGNNIAGEIAANPAAYGLQLPAGTDLSHLGFPAAGICTVLANRSSANSWIGRSQYPTKRRFLSPDILERLSGALSSADS